MFNFKISFSIKQKTIFKTRSGIRYSAATLAATAFLMNLSNTGTLAVEDKIPSSGSIDGSVKWVTSGDAETDYVYTPATPVDVPNDDYIDLMTGDNAIMVMPQTTTLGTLSGAHGTEPTTGFHLRLKVTELENPIYIPVPDFETPTTGNTVVFPTSGMRDNNGAMAISRYGS